MFVLAVDGGGCKSVAPPPVLVVIVVDVLMVRLLVFFALRDKKLNTQLESRFGKSKGFQQPTTLVFGKSHTHTRATSLSSWLLLLLATTLLFFATGPGPPFRLCLVSSRFDTIFFWGSCWGEVCWGSVEKQKKVECGGIHTHPTSYNQLHPRS